MTSLAHTFAVPLPHRHRLERARLLAATDRPAALILFRGSVGSGKTTELAHWARTRSASAASVWLELDAVHSEPTQFWRLVATALNHAGLIDMHEVLLEASEQVSPELLQRVLVARNTPIVLALDDADTLSAAAVDEIVDVLSVVSTLTIGVAARPRGAFESHHVRLSIDTIVVDAPELEFTPAETAAVLAAAGLPSNPKTVQLVRSVCGGHPKVTRAAFASLRSTRKPRFAELRATVLDLVGWNRSSPQALAEGDPVLAEFMMRSSVLELVPVAFANDLVLHMAREAEDTGLAGAVREMSHDAGSTYLNRIESLGFGAWDDAATPAAFRYSTIGRNALRAALEEGAPAAEGTLEAASVSPDEALKFAADWLASHGDPVQSFFLALASEDYELASRSAARGISELLSDHTEELRSALGPLAPAVLHEHPLLAMILALSYNQIARMRLRAIDYFGITIAGAKRARPRLNAEDRVVLDASVSAAFRITGQGERAAASARIALDGLASLTVDERMGLGRLGEIVTVQCGISLLYGGDQIAALEAFHRTPHVENSEYARQALAAMAGTHALVGEMRNAAELVVENSALFWPEHGPSDYNGSLFQLGRAWLALEDFDFLAAQHDKDSLDEHISTFEHWPFFAEIQARIDLFSGNAAAGIDRLQAVRRRNRGRADIGIRGRQRLDIALSTLYLSAGRIRQAESVLATPKAADAARLVAQARVQLVRDQPEAAMVLLVRAETLPLTERERAEQLALECAAQLRLGQPSLATVTLDRLVAVLEVSGLRTPLALLPVEDLTALRARAGECGSDGASRLLNEPIPTVLSHVRAIILSRREQVVLRKLVESGSVADIADDLFVSPNTVKTQLRSLYRKLGVSSREDALVVAITQQLLDND